MHGDNYYNSQLISIFQNYQQECKGVFEVHRTYFPAHTYEPEAGYGYTPYDYVQEENKARLLRNDLIIITERQIEQFKIDFDACCAQCNVAVIM